jgi:adenylate cyclase
MEIHATLLSNLLNNHRVRQAGPIVPYLLGLLLCIAGSALFFSLKTVRPGIIASVVLGFLYFAFVLGAFYVLSWWVPLVGPEFALATTFLLATVASYATEGRQKRQLRKAFARYLSPQVVTEILQNIDQIELGGKLIEGTVYFSDIKNFTTVSEQHSPKDLVTMLNEYLSLASECILRNDAMLDKYIGDAIMAIFGAPISRADHAKVACLTALEVQRTLTEFYKQRATENGGVLFETRIGLNSGNMIVGNIGHTNRLDYTAIGDTVNLASRLEGVNKVFGTKILVSESTYLKAADYVRVRELDLLRVKGKHQPIRIYELIGDKSTLPDAVEDKLGQFEGALAAYRRRDFATATNKFKEILEFDPADGPSLAYLERCRILSHETLPDFWDGVYTLTSK